MEEIECITFTADAIKESEELLFPAIKNSTQFQYIANNSNFQHCNQPVRFKSIGNSCIAVCPVCDLTYTSSEFVESCSRIASTSDIAQIVLSDKFANLDSSSSSPIKKFTVCTQDANFLSHTESTDTIQIHDIASLSSTLIASNIAMTIF